MISAKRKLMIGMALLMAVNGKYCAPCSPSKPCDVTTETCTERVATYDGGICILNTESVETTGCVHGAINQCDVCKKADESTTNLLLKCAGADNSCIDQVCQATSGDCVPAKNCEACGKNPNPLQQCAKAGDSCQPNGRCAESEAASKLCTDAPTKMPTKAPTKAPPTKAPTSNAEKLRPISIALLVLSAAMVLLN